MGMGRLFSGYSSLLGFMRKPLRRGDLQDHTSLVGFMRKPCRRGYLQDHTSPVGSMSGALRRYSVDAKARDRRQFAPPFWKRSMRRVLCALGFEIDYTIGKPYLDELFDVKKECDRRRRDDRKERSLYGDTVVDVYRVIVEIHDDDAKGKLPGGEGYLSGQIFLTDGDDPAYAYKQDGHSGLYIKGKHEVLITAKPNGHHFIDCSDSMYLYVDLRISSTTSYHNLIELDKGKYVRIHNFEGYFNKNGKFRQLYFDALELCSASARYSVDEFRAYTLATRDRTCSVTVLFAYYIAAVQAHVEVVWLGGKNKSGTGVYGLIAAKVDLSNTCNDDDTDNDDTDNDDTLSDDTDTDNDDACDNSACDNSAFETILFLKEDSSQSVRAISGEAIELSRSLIAVPIKEKLVIRAHLRCKSKLFPAAKLTFPSEQSGTSELTVDGIFKVKVTWSYFFASEAFTERYLIDNRLL